MLRPNFDAPIIFGDFFWRKLVYGQCESTPNTLRYSILIGCRSLLIINCYQG